MILHLFNKFILNAGVKESDSAARTRAIRISNLICLTAIMNCLIFGLILNYLGSKEFFNACVIAGIIYSAAHWISYLGNPNIGRMTLLISGNLIIFYFSCISRGEANFQLFFFSLTTAGFMHFSWEERKYFLLSVLPVLLYLFGDYYYWNFFEIVPMNYELRLLRLISMLAPLFQIVLGFFYILKQSVKFEAESIENLRKLEIEHSKQIQVQKMSSLGEMAGGIAHEINNPLMVILGSTYHMKKELNKMETKDHSLFTRMEKIEGMVNRIVRIIQALKNISRNSENDPREKIFVHELIDSSLDLCRERFVSNNIMLEISGDSTLEIHCRPTEITQVILNLLNNAFDATNLRQDSKVSISYKQIESKIQITVEDNGHGIPHEIIDKIMQPFFSTKEIGKGTGLGLSISKGLIESNQGSLMIIPNTGKTTFQILLPVIS